MAAKATVGSVSNQIVDPDYIAPPGVPPEVAIENGVPDAGLPEDARHALEREREQARPADSDDRGTGEDESSPGKTSSEPSTTREPSTSKPSGAGKNRSNARTTNGPSNERPRGSSTVSTGDTSSSPADRG